MEPVRTPSQAIVILVFLIITIFTFDNDETTTPDSYTELYLKPGERLDTSYSQSVNFQLNHSYKKAPLSHPDNIYNKVNYHQGPDYLQRRFTNFVHPVVVAWPVH